MAAGLTDKMPVYASIGPDEVRSALDRIFASKHFAHAPMKRKFLRHVCDFYLNGRANELNEYLIGREVFERDDTYNPAADPIVRVGAHDLRKKLELYYASEGSGDEVRLEIPVGSYEPVFVRSAETPPERPVALTQKSETLATSLPNRRDKRLVIALGAVIGSFVLVVTLMGLWNWRLQRQIDDVNLLRDGSSYGSVWEPFLKADDQTLLVISNPAVYRFSNSIDPDILIKRSVGLNSEQASDLGDALRDRFVMKQNRVPRLVLSPDDYTGMGEAIGLYRITDLFRSTGKGLLLKQSRTASAEDLKNHNVILLGSVWANEWSGKLPLREEFVYTGNATIELADPIEDEPREYRPEFDPRTGDLMVDYALVTVKPNISFEDTVMVLAGIHSEGTEAATEYVTSKNYLNDLNLRLRQAGNDSGPLKYYQALLKVGVENGIPTTISFVTLRELRLGRD